MKIGDLVKYKKSNFALTRYGLTQIGTIIEVRSNLTQEETSIKVKWNTREIKFQVMWHNPVDLEIINESR